MRSATPSDLPGRCRRCWVVARQCVCAAIEPTHTATRILIVRHPREATKPTNTARIAALALPNAALVDFTGDERAITERLAQSADGACLLYPGNTWRPRPVSTLVVLDGTWSEVGRMRRRLPSLWTLPTLTLPPPTVDVVRLRDPISAAGRSTLEAIAEAVALLEGPERAAPLFALHSRYVEAVLRGRGHWEQRSARVSAVRERLR